MGTSFFGGRGPAPQVDEAPLVEVRGYWQALCGPDGRPPLRSAVDPRGIAGALEHAFIADRVAPGIARFRLAGAALCDLLGMDLRGMPMLSLIDPPARAGFAEAVEAAMMGLAILDMTLEAERGIGRPALAGRLLMLPLRRADGSPGLALGCLATGGTVGRAPRRFAIARRGLVQLAPALPAKAPAPGMAEARAPFLSRSERPWLRLVRTAGGDG